MRVSRKTLIVFCDSVSTAWNDARKELEDGECGDCVVARLLSALMDTTVCLIFPYRDGVYRSPR